nr:hypothetical protein TetV2_00109 [Oceanusvirus sp.]
MEDATDGIRIRASEAKYEPPLSSEGICAMCGSGLESRRRSFCGDKCSEWWHRETRRTQSMFELKPSKRTAAMRRVSQD